MTAPSESSPLRALAETPLRVRVTRSVSSDPSMFLETQTTIGPGEYKATINAQGAVAVLLHDGGRLGVKPHEFEFIAENVVDLLSRVERAEADSKKLREIEAICQRNFRNVPMLRQALAYERIYDIATPKLATPENLRAV